MTAYYNEIDPYAAEWLRRLINNGVIAPGEVDTRSITEVHADDFAGFTQAHFFAGIGGWSLALRSAGWADDRPVWTGSCPCQPFSAAGAGNAGNDERHLWPAWFSLIAQRRPAIVFGEQVEAAIGWGWLDAVFADMEGEGYACGATVLPACSVGASHIRQRLWFVANSQCGRVRLETGSDSRAPEEICGEVGQQRLRPDTIPGGDSSSPVANADGGDASTERQQRGGQHGQQPQDGGAGKLVNPNIERHERAADRTWPAGRRQFAEPSTPIDMANAQGRGQREQRDATQPRSGGHPDGSFWAGAEWITCTDGKARPIEPGSFPLAHGVQRRPSKLRAYGNAIVPQVAAEFISAYLEA